MKRSYNYGGAVARQPLAPANRSFGYNGCQYYSIVIENLPDGVLRIDDILLPIREKNRNCLVAAHDPRDKAEAGDMPSEYDGKKLAFLLAYI